MQLSIAFSLAVALILHLSTALILPKNVISNRPARTSTKLREVPMELIDQLDPAKSWEVKFVLGDEEKTAIVSEDTSLLEAGEKIFPNVPSSCRNGVCTTCAAEV